MKRRIPGIKDVKLFVEQSLACKAETVQFISQGYYGFIYLIRLNRPPFFVIGKAYKIEGLLDQEECQLNFLRKYAMVAVPEVYGKGYYAYNSVCDILFMEYIQGVNAASYDFSSSNKREKFCHDVVSNLLSLHAVINPLGFGGLHATCYESSWINYYKKQIEAVYSELRSNCIQELSQEYRTIVDDVYAMFDQIFLEDLHEGVLIHGDYNLWNLMIDPRDEKLIGMIDPLDCCFADKELDLVQLLSVKKEGYNFLKIYTGYTKVSDKFEIKIMYYHFWDNLKHLVTAKQYDEHLHLKIGQALIGLFSP